MTAQVAVTEMTESAVRASVTSTASISAKVWPRRDTPKIDPFLL